MSTEGFEEALQSAVRLRISVAPEVVVAVASIAALAVLKLIAWSEEPTERSRDALDLYFILQNYSEAGQNERLVTLATGSDFDYREAGVRLLGQDMWAITTPMTGKAVLDILTSEIEGTGGRRLVSDMIRDEFDQEDTFKLAIRLLTVLRDALSSSGP
jgi:predicted nucleotidyltransferase